MLPDTKECPFCAETIKAKAIKCRYCHEFMPGYSREQFYREHAGDSFEIGPISEAQGVAVGQDSQAAVAGQGATVFQAQGDIRPGPEERDEQYKIATNWDGKTNMRGFDLAGRNLSELNLRAADLQGAFLYNANLDTTDLRKANLEQANLQMVSLRSVKLCKNGIEGTFFDYQTLWPAGFDPIAAGAVKGKPPQTMIRMA